MSFGCYETEFCTLALDQGIRANGCAVREHRDALTKARKVQFELVGGQSHCSEHALGKMGRG